MPATLPEHAQKRRYLHPGVVRRVQALAVAGWTRPVLAAELRISECHLTRVYAGRVSFPQLAVRIAALYDRLNGLEPQQTPASRITRGRALAAGWLGPDAWTPDSIDDPDGRPLTRRARARVEDLAWMADTGESLAGACHRLKADPETVHRGLLRAHRTDLWIRLTARGVAMT